MNINNSFLEFPTHVDIIHDCETYVKSIAMLHFDELIGFAAKCTTIASCNHSLRLLANGKRLNNGTIICVHVGHTALIRYDQDTT